MKLIQIPLLVLVLTSCATLGPDAQQGSPVIEETPESETNSYRPKAERSAPQKQNAAVSSLLKRAKDHLTTGKLELAQSYLERAYRIDYRDGEVSFLMAKLLYAKGLPDQAEQWALRAVERFTRNDVLLRRKAWELVSQCRLKMGDYAGADEAVEQANQQ